MAKNSEVYTTAQERAEAFREFCEKAQVDCAKCPANDGCEYKYSAEGALNWLDLDAEEEPLQPCYMCGSHRITSYKADVGYSLICRDCGYCAGTADTREEIEVKHNRVAKAVKESEAKK